MDFRDNRLKNFDHGWCSARNQLIAHLLKSLEPKSSSWNILDVGCGTGEQFKLYEKFGQTTGLDIDPSALQNSNNSIIIGDIETYPLLKNSYDIICCFDVLEHVKNDSLALVRCWQALKPRGYILITVPAYNWLFSNHDKTLHHLRRYGYKELKNKLEEANFTMLKLRHWNSLFFLPIAVLRLGKKILGWTKGSELNYLPSWLNGFIYKCLLFENWLIKHHCRLPLGLSLYAVAKKNEG